MDMCQYIILVPRSGPYEANLFLHGVVPIDFVETHAKYVYFPFMLFCCGAPRGPGAPPGPKRARGLSRAQGRGPSKAQGLPSKCVCCR